MYVHIHTRHAYTYLCYKYHCLCSVAQAQCWPPQTGKGTPSTYLQCLLPTRPQMHIPYLTWLCPALLDSQACACAQRTVPCTHSFLSFHGQIEGEERRRNFICNVRLCSGFNRGSQGQQVGRGGAERFALARDKGPGEGGSDSKRRRRGRGKPVS